MKEIYIKNPDGDLCYDGEETNDPEFDEMLEDWRFENEHVQLLKHSK